jgi:hypothetical protein
MHECFHSVATFFVDTKISNYSKIKVQTSVLKLQWLIKFYGRETAEVVKRVDYPSRMTVQSKAVNTCSDKYPIRPKYHKNIAMVAVITTHTFLNIIP